MWTCELLVLQEHHLVKKQNPAISTSIISNNSMCINWAKLYSCLCRHYISSSLQTTSTKQDLVSWIMWTSCATSGNKTLPLLLHLLATKQAIPILQRWRYHEWKGETKEQRDRYQNGSMPLFFFFSNSTIVVYAKYIISYQNCSNGLLSRCLSSWGSSVIMDTESSSKLC